MPSFRDAQLAGTWEQVKLLLEILDNSDTAEAVSTDEIANMLMADLRKAQENILKRLQRPSVNDRVDQLLACNDMLVNAFAYYDGLSKGTMRRRNAQDEARRVAAEEDLVFAERPHVKRASSFNMEDHDVKLVRDSQDPNIALHQYSSDAAQSSFSYAVPGQQPSVAQSRSPSVGDNSMRRSDNGAAAPGNAGLGAFMTQQPIRTHPAAAHTQPQGEQSVSRTQPLLPSTSGAARAASATSRLSSHTHAAAESAGGEVSDGSSSVSSSNSQVKQYTPEPYRMDAPIASQSRSPSPITPRTQPAQQPQSQPQSQPNVPAAPAMQQPTYSAQQHSLPQQQPQLQPQQQQQPVMASNQPTMPTMPTIMPAMPPMPAGAPNPFAQPFPNPMAAGGSGGATMTPEQYQQWMSFMQQQMAMMHHAMMQQQQQQQYQPAPAFSQPQQGEAGGAVPPQQQGESAAAPSASGEQGEQAQGEQGESVEKPFGQMNISQQRR